MRQKRADESQLDISRDRVRRAARLVACVAALAVGSAAFGQVGTTEIPDEFADGSAPRNFFVGPPEPGSPHAANEEEPAKPPVAANIDLSQPVVTVPDAGAIDIGQIAPPRQPELREYEQQSLVILGTEVAASTSARLSWSPDDSFASIAVPTPVLVVNGSKAGPTMCVTAAIHGDELNGIEVVRRVLYDLDSENLAGAVIGVPIVNLQGFQRASRYLPDRRDLNRYFPGNAMGSSASRLAHSFFNEVIAHCDALIDVHTGSFHRANLPQLRADLRNPDILRLSRNFGATVVLHSSGATGTLRRAAADAGIPAVTLEAGEPARVQEDAVAHGAKGVMTLLNELGMYKKAPRWGTRESVYYRSRWERADSGGVLFSTVELGDHVDKDQVLGTITDPITNVQTEIRASREGRILGMALNQFVMPGFAAYRIGIEPTASQQPDFEEEGISDDADDIMDAEHIGGDADVAAGTFGPVDEVIDARDSLEDSE